MDVQQPSIFQDEGSTTISQESKAYYKLVRRKAEHLIIR